jgi:hypothetical protein
MSARDLGRQDDEAVIRNALFGPDAIAGGDEDEGEFVRVRLSDLDLRLPEALGLMVRSPSRWILTVETISALYVQFLATEDGVLVAECVSNEFLHGHFGLSEEAEELLPVLGWDWPAPPDQLNWIKVEFDENAVLDSAVLALHTLRRVFGCGDDDVVYAQFFRSPMQRDGGSGDSEMRPDGV